MGLKPAYVSEYEAASLAFDMARQLIEARVSSGLSQDELAKKMGTSQSTIARLESGTSLPSIRTLVKYAEATSCDFRFSLKPKKHRVSGAQL
jgi:transcriptional regulator with XRE-family HTH domain